MKLILDDRLTEKEKELRDYMVNKFNPALKLLMGYADENKFKMWGYNSCRQTAIFGSWFATEKINKLNLPYKVHAYEAIFDDVMEGTPVDYDHGYIVLESMVSSRRILVDLSRTTHSMLFHVRDYTDEDLYPTDIPEYKDIVIRKVMELPWETLIGVNEIEYMTGLPSMEVLGALMMTIENLESLDKERLKKVVDRTYQAYTYDLQDALQGMKEGKIEEKR